MLFFRNTENQGTGLSGNSLPSRWKGKVTVPKNQESFRWDPEGDMFFSLCFLPPIVPICYPRNMDGFFFIIIILIKPFYLAMWKPFCCRFRSKEAATCRRHPKDTPEVKFTPVTQQQSKRKALEWVYLLNTKRSVISGRRSADCGIIEEVPQQGAWDRVYEVCSETQWWPLPGKCVRDVQL